MIAPPHLILSRQLEPISRIAKSARLAFFGRDLSNHQSVVLLVSNPNQIKANQITGTSNRTDQLCVESEMQEQDHEQM